MQIEARLQTASNPIRNTFLCFGDTMEWLEYDVNVYWTKI